jgi:TRAP-type C4-dicarboxylate transport system permease small subunit
MSEGSHDPESAVIRKYRWVRSVVRLCEIGTILALVGMVLVISVDVVTRNFLHFSYQVSDELSGYFLVAATFLAMPVALAHDAFHKVQFLENTLSERTRAKLQILVAVLALAVCLTMEWSLARFVVLSFQSGSIAMTDLATPLWLPQLLMPVGFGLLSLVMAAVIFVKIAALRALPPDQPASKRAQP